MKIKIPNDPQVWEQIEIDIQNGYDDTMSLRELIEDYQNCKYIKGYVNMFADMFEKMSEKLKEVKNNEQ